MHGNVPILWQYGMSIVSFCVEDYPLKMEIEQDLSLITIRALVIRE